MLKVLFKNYSTGYQAILHFESIDMIPDNTNDCVYLIVNFEQLTY